MHSLIRVILVAFAPLLLMVTSIKGTAQEPKLTLTIKTDRNRYDLDDTILVAAAFSGDGRAQIQLAKGNSAVSFYLVLQSLDRKDANGKGFVICRPAWELQFVNKPFIEQRPKAYAIEVSSGFEHQLAIRLPNIRNLPEGRYTIRIGYALGAEGLKALIKDATGQEPAVDGGGGREVDGAFGGALLSEPITITIGSEKKKP